MSIEKHVLCLKWGERYSSDYVNRLYRAVQKNSIVPHRFHCLTDNSDGLDSDINVLLIPKEEQHLWGWWHKVALFKEDFYGLRGDLLFIDLDMLILDNIDDFLLYKPGQFIMAKNYVPGFAVSSCIMRIPLGGQAKIWNDFVEDSENATLLYKKRGDQLWIQDHAIHYEFWPKDWVIYYKESCRYRLTLIDFKLPQKLLAAISHRFKLYATEPTTGKILAFQGKPDMNDIMENPFKKYRAAPWIKKYWHV